MSKIGEHRTSNIEVEEFAIERVGLSIDFRSYP